MLLQVQRGARLKYAHSLFPFISRLGDGQYVVATATHSFHHFSQQKLAHERIGQNRAGKVFRRMRASDACMHQVH
jgi:hypothetical protein